jgi:hypothetical protein
MLLAGLMAVVLLFASALPASTMADDAAHMGHSLLSAEPVSSDDDGLAKILHSCAHCQSHHTAYLDVAATVITTRSSSVAVWNRPDERPVSARAAPLPRPPKA